MILPIFAVHIENKKGATKLLAKNGEIHITSKEVKPYSWWRIHTLANGLPNTAFVGKLGFDPKRCVPEQASDLLYR